VTGKGVVPKSFCGIESTASGALGGIAAEKIEKSNFVCIEN
jgi:hypothetical protein